MKRSKLIGIIASITVFFVLFIAMICILPMDDSSADVDSTTTSVTTKPKATTKATTTKATTTAPKTTTTKATTTKTTTTVKPTTTTVAPTTVTTTTTATQGDVNPPEDPVHTHTEVVDAAVAPTCQKTGLTEGKHCSGCDEIFLAQEEVPVIECIASDWIIDKEATINEDGSKHKECTMCGKRMSEEAIPILSGSAGLMFALNDDEASYSVVHVGKCEDTVVMIPRYYEGKPVTGIAIGAFAKCDNITSVVMPISITTIGQEAFAQCSGITSLVMPDSITSIGDNAFQKCTALKDITWSNSLESIGVGAFSYCESLENIVLPDGLKTISLSAFYNCTSLTSVIIPASVTNVGMLAFVGCESLQIYCEADSKPSGWENPYFDGEIVWGYTAE